MQKPECGCKLRGVAYGGGPQYTTETRSAEFNLEMLCRQRLNYAEKVIRVKGCDYGTVRGP